MKKRIILALVLLLLVVLGGIGIRYLSPGIASAKQQQQPPESHDADTDHEALRSSPLSSSGSCGLERWAIKTGTDADVGLIALQSTTQTTIASLTALPTPGNLPPNNRIQPNETTIFQLHDTLTEYKLENDSDYHLILNDGAGNTMIVEIPDPACVSSSSPLLPGIQKARSEFDARYTVTTSFQTANVPVTVTGVGFFDFLHGQTGVAPNGVELHATLDVQFGNSGTPTPTATSIPTPQPTSIPTPTGTPPTSNLMQNGGFETSGSWNYTGTNSPIRTTSKAHSGSYSLQVGTTSKQQGDAVASQIVTIPSATTHASLSFYYWPSTNDSSKYAWQEADISNSNGQVIQQLFRKTTNDRAWIPLTFDLSKYRGQTIDIQFLDHENSNGASYYAYMYVDDVVLTIQ